MNSLKIEPIAYIESDFKEKFGIPRQSGIAKNLTAKIIFTKKYQNPDALRGIEGFSHLWLIFNFNKAKIGKWQPTVRPPRLGGNQKVGVFATRSPFRPNSLGLSCVKLIKVESSKNNGNILIVSGADLLDGTPIIDIKPYLPYCDNVPDATSGFTENIEKPDLKVEFLNNCISEIPHNLQKGLTEALAQDPRPQYQNDENRIYNMFFNDYNVSFKISNDTLFVTEIKKC